MCSKLQLGSRSRISETQCTPCISVLLRLPRRRGLDDRSRYTTTIDPYDHRIAEWGSRAGLQAVTLTVDKSSKRTQRRTTSDRYKKYGNSGNWSGGRWISEDDAVNKRNTLITLGFRFLKKIPTAANRNLLSARAYRHTTQPACPIITRSSAIAEGPRDASCQLKSCQLPRNSAETTYTTSPDQIDGMKLEI